MTQYDILSRLQGVKQHGDRYMACCPCHGDKTPSLSVCAGKDGRILLKCFAGCAPEQIVAALGLTMQDLFPEPARSAQPRVALEAEYAYAGGRLKKRKYRRPDGSKFCTWCYWDGHSWQKGRHGMAPGLYGTLPEGAPLVFLVEGEKDVDTLKAAGMPAVSLPDGSGSRWEAAYDAVFRDKQVVILPDHDEPGRKYAQMCAENLYGKAACLWVEALQPLWPEIPEKGDVSDMVQALGMAEATRRIGEALTQLPPWEPKPEKPDTFLTMFKPLRDFEEQEANWIIPGWIPEGQITLIAADGGVGKTTLWCDIMAALSAGRPCILDPEGYHREPQKVAFCTTEDSVRKKLVKKLRQAQANMDNITAMDMAADHDGELRSFKFGNPSMERFVKHYKPKVCVFDPVQGFIPPEVNMASRNAMRDCMAHLITLGEEVGTTFVIICHTNKRKGASGRDRIADSADLWDIARSVIMAGYAEEKGVRYLSNEKNNYASLQETILFTIGDDGRLRGEGRTWKRDRDYTAEGAASRWKPQQDDCRNFLLSTLEQAPEKCMKVNDLVQEAQRRGYSFKTIERAKTEMMKAGQVETFAKGSSRKGFRAFYIRRKEPLDGFYALPYDLPTPFDSRLD